MTESLDIGKTLSIRECGYSENDLQAHIYRDPRILGLGDLEAVTREKKQSSGGKLDILLKDPEDDSMFEVEIMLGATDESHIIRTIEYWDIEKKRWPQRKHFAVIVAESMTRRFFNVIQVLSISIPIIAIQVNAIEANGRKILHFTKILDIYEEQEEEISSSDGIIYDRNWWQTNVPGNLANAEIFQQQIAPMFKEISEEVNIGFVQYYISLKIDNSIYFKFRKRSGRKSSMEISLNNSLISEAKAIFDEKGIPYRIKPSSNYFELIFTVDQKLIESNSDLFVKIGSLVKKSWF